MTSLAGSFLVAKSVLQDPNFAQTVVLLLQHGPEGALGLVVNREAAVEGLPFTVFVGGPCESQGLFMLHGHAEWAEPSADDRKTQIAPGIFLGDATCAERVTDPSEGQTLRFRMFAGYAGFRADCSIKRINEWNRTKRFSRAYIDDEGDPCIEADLDFDGGVTHDTVKEFVRTFRLSVRQFGRFIAEK